MSKVEPKRIAKKYFNYDSGFYIEAGAADGVSQSNTLFLEKQRSWSGILIEPNTEDCVRCMKNRRRSKVFNCALVSHEYDDTEIEMYFRKWNKNDPGLVTSTFDSPINKIDAWEKYNYSYKIPARTLDSILEECEVKTIDFFSLDVEGYEHNVLKGFNFEKYKPKIILIESHEQYNEIDKITELLKNCYEIVENPTPNDYIFKYKER
jgi:FkbM family methyltransferase